MSQQQRPTSSLSSEQEYWLPGYGLSRHIVLRQLQSFLGPSATVRPYSYQGREGYMIVGARLTTQQIADLKRQSKEYERQQTIRMSGRRAAVESQVEDADINAIVVVGNGYRSPPTTTYSYRHYR